MELELQSGWGFTIEKSQIKQGAGLDLQGRKETFVQGHHG